MVICPEEALAAAGRPPATIEVVELDLSSLSSVRTFAENFLKEDRPLHLLCLNAGIMAIPKYTTSADGFEMQFATNHLGHFALTTALLKRIVESAPARVVTLASEAHRAPSEAYDLDDWPPGASKYGDWRAYQQSKLANILFARCRPSISEVFPAERPFCQSFPQSLSYHNPETTVLDIYIYINPYCGNF